MLAEMTDAGLIGGNRKTFKERGQLPPWRCSKSWRAILTAELIAEPAVWDRTEEKNRARSCCCPASARRRAAGGWTG